MFSRPHHVQIATILEALDSDLLMKHHCFFGGGTAIVLSRKEYRESADIDFLISDRNGYRTLRELVRGKIGIHAIVRKGIKLREVRELRTDQYGIRTMLRVGSTEIKFEIVFEARIALDAIDAKDRICGVPTLSLLDMATTKLLANSDRWADDAVFNRDLIDLAMLQMPRPLFVRAIEKATSAYGANVTRDLARAIERLGARRGRLDECMSALKIDDIPKALLWKRIRRLRPGR